MNEFTSGSASASDKYFGGNVRSTVLYPEPKRNLIHMNLGSFTFEDKTFLTVKCFTRGNRVTKEDKRYKKKKIGPAEKSGKIAEGDILLEISNIPTENRSISWGEKRIEFLASQKRPIRLILCKRAELRETLGADLGKGLIKRLPKTPKSTLIKKKVGYSSDTGAPAAAVAISHESSGVPLAHVPMSQLRLQMKNGQLFELRPHQSDAVQQMRDGVQQDLVQVDPENPSRLVYVTMDDDAIPIVECEVRTVKSRGGKKKKTASVKKSTLPPKAKAYKAYSKKPPSLPKAKKHAETQSLKQPRKSQSWNKGKSAAIKKLLSEPRTVQSWSKAKSSSAMEGIGGGRRPLPRPPTLTKKKVPPPPKRKDGTAVGGVAGGAADEVAMLQKKLEKLKSALRIAVDDDDQEDIVDRLLERRRVLRKKLKEAKASAQAEARAREEAEARRAEAEDRARAEAADRACEEEEAQVDGVDDLQDELDEIDELGIQLQEAVSAMEFLQAAQLKDQIAEAKAAMADKLRESMDSAIASQDFNAANDLKEMLQKLKV